MKKKPFDFPKNLNEISNWSELRFVEVIRSGIHSKYLDSLQNSLHTSRSNLLNNLKLSESNIRRRKSGDKKLSPVESEKVLNTLKVFFKAVDVFSDHDHAAKWMTEEHSFLNNASPLSLCDTGAGCQSVINILGQIDHGIPA